MKNVISIDVEQWFHRGILRKHLENVDRNSTHILASVVKLLKILGKYNKTTTFFVVGEVAEHVPQVLEEISAKGHEVAFHGYSHLRLDELGKDKFEEELVIGVNALRHITKEEPKGFRAPEFSLNKRSAWALRLLVKHHFEYDSSIFPVKTPKYGAWNAPLHPYLPSFDDPAREDPDQTKILEFPLLVRKKMFLKIPAAGGFYLRVFGPNFIIDSIKYMNKKRHPAMCYIHPWEVCGVPKIVLPIHKAAFAYFRIPSLKMFEHLIRNVSIAPARKVLEDLDWFETKQEVCMQ